MPAWRRDRIIMKSSAWGHALAALVMVVIAVGGCAPMATYPPVSETDPLLSRPQLSPIPELMAKAVAFAHERYAPARPVVVNLPPGTPAEVYDDVFERLGGGEPMLQPDQPAFHVTEVRVRGLDAEVDIIYPRTDYAYEFATLYFERGVMSSFRVEHARLWRIEVTPPEPHYEPPAVEAAEPGEGAGLPPGVRETSNRVDPE